MTYKYILWPDNFVWILLHYMKTHLENKKLMELNIKCVPIISLYYT